MYPGHEDALSTISPMPQDQQQQQQQQSCVSGGQQQLPSGCRSSSDDGVQPDDGQRSTAAAVAAMAVAAATAAPAAAAAPGAVAVQRVNGAPSALSVVPPQLMTAAGVCTSIMGLGGMLAGPLRPSDTSNAATGGAPVAALGLAQAASMASQGRLSWDAGDLDVGLLLAAAAAHMAPASTPGLGADLQPQLLFDGANAGGAAGSAFALQSAGTLSSLMAASALFGAHQLAADRSGTMPAQLAPPQAAAHHSYIGQAPMAAAPGLRLPAPGAAAAGAPVQMSRFGLAHDGLPRFPAGSIRTARPFSAAGDSSGTAQIPSGMPAAGCGVGFTGAAADYIGNTPLSAAGSAPSDASSPSAPGGGDSEAGGSTPMKKTRRGCRGGRQKRWYMAQQMAAAAAMGGAGVSSYDVYRALSSGVPIGAVLPGLAASGISSPATGGSPATGADSPHAQGLKWCQTAGGWVCGCCCGACS